MRTVIGAALLMVASGGWLESAHSQNTEAPTSQGRVSNGDILEYVCSADKFTGYVTFKIELFANSAYATATRYKIEPAMDREHSANLDIDIEVWDANHSNLKRLGIASAGGNLRQDNQWHTLTNVTAGGNAGYKVGYVNPAGLFVFDKPQAGDPRCFAEKAYGEQVN